MSAAAAIRSFTAAMAMFAWLCGVLLVAAAPGTARADDVPTTIGLQIGHGSNADTLAFSPDGRTMVSGSSDTTVKLWDVATGRLLRSMAGAQSNVWAVAYSPDGRQIVSGQEDGFLRLWDPVTGRQTRALKAHEHWVTSIAFSPDGHTMATGGFDHTVKLWDPSTLRAIRTIQADEGVNSVVFSADGLTIAAGANKVVAVWDVATGRLLRRVTRYEGTISSVAVSPDGRTIASGTVDGKARLSDVRTGQAIRVLDRETTDSQVVRFSPDGAWLALLGADEVQIRDVATWRVTHRLPGYAFTIAVSPDGTTIATGAGDRSVKLWDAASGRELHSLVSFGAVNAVAVSPDGRRIASASKRKTIGLWDAPTGRLDATLSGHTDEVQSAAFSPDGRTLATGGMDKTVRLWDVNTGRPSRVLAQAADWTQSVAFSPDGRILAAGVGSAARSWDVASGRGSRSFAGSEGSVNAVAYSPDGSRLVAASNDHAILLWDVASGKVLRTLTGHTNGNTAVAFSPDGQRIVSGGLDGTVRIWTASNGRSQHALSPGFLVSSVAFSPDGRTIAAAGDTTIALIDAESGQESRRFVGSQTTVTSLGFSPDGRWLTGGSDEGAIRRWSLDGRLLATSITTADGEWVTVTPEGFFDGSDKGGGLLNVVHGMEVSSIDQLYDALHRPDLVREKLAGDPRGRVRDAAATLDLGRAVASGAPPRVALQAPAPASRASGHDVTVEATATDAGGGIGRIEWRVNGVTLGLDARGADRMGQGASKAGPGPRTLAIRQVLPVRAGHNTIDLRVYNAAGLVASSPVSRDVEVEGPAVRPRLFVLAAGVDAYDDGALRLNYSKADAGAVADALRVAGARLYRSVEVTTLVDKAVTADGLDAAFATLGATMSPDDVFVFYIAGHGKTVEARYYFLPRDFRYEGDRSIAAAGIGQDRWQDWLKRIPAQKSILLYDTCDSGTLTVGAVASRGLEEKTALDLLTRATGRTTLTAATGDAPALEGYRGHGVFTYALLEALDRGDLDGNGVIDLDELITYVNRAVPDISEKAFHVGQFPQVARSGGNFPLVARAAVLPAGTGVEAVIPRTPTHVVVAEARVFRDAAADTSVVTALGPGTQVRLLKADGGWTLVARDGERIGYVDSRLLLALH